MEERTQEVTSVDLDAIAQAAIDYIESWLEGDAERMRRCLHPKLVNATRPRASGTSKG